jgi:hypothetical protein
MPSDPKRAPATTSSRRQTSSWIAPCPATTDDETRILLRLRMAPIKRVWLAKSAGELLDLLTIAGMAAGLRERLGDRERG